MDTDERDVRDGVPPRAQTRSQGDGYGADGHLVVGERGEMQLSEAERLRWAITPGAEFALHATPDGLLLRRKDAALSKVYVEPTSTCNLDCRTCVRQSWSEPMGTMEMETYHRLIEGLRSVPSLHTVAFWGFGEPLLHPQILEMVALAKELGAKTELISNGLLLNEAMAEGLVAAGLDTLVISVDGATAEAYADIRAGGNLEQVKRNVARLLTIRQWGGHANPEIGIEFVAMRRNLDQLPELGHLAYELGASFIVVSNVLPHTEELKDEILYGMWAGRSYLTQRSPVNPEVLLPRLDLRRETIEPTIKLVARSGYVQPPTHNGHTGGGYCRFVNEGAIAVGWDGELSPCIALMHSYPCYVMRREKQIRRYTLGNVAQHSAADLWARDEYVAFRERVRRFEFAPCADCGGCNMSETNEEDCFGNPFPVCGDCLWAKGVLQCP